jgi:diaminopimelate epimerase
MDVHFAKMHGAANDFVVLEGVPPGDAETTRRLVASLCDRRQGIGADGALWMERLAAGGPLFHMHFYNSDGGRAVQCFNGGRCCARRAVELGWIARDSFVYRTDAGEVRARVAGDEIELWAAPPRQVGAALPLPPGSLGHSGTPITTGDPHLVIELDPVLWEQLDVERHGRPLRWWKGAFAEGNNVHFVLRNEAARWHIRTFERGIEGETWACGSGCLAAVRALGSDTAVELRTRAGHRLRVSPGEQQWGIGGPAVTVFTGTWQGVS